MTRENYCFGVPRAGWYKPLLSSDEAQYGGADTPLGAVRSKKVPLHGQEQSISVTLPAFSVVYLSAPAPAAQKPAPAKKLAAPKSAGRKPRAKKTAPEGAAQ